MQHASGACSAAVLLCARFRSKGCTDGVAARRLKEALPQTEALAVNTNKKRHEGKSDASRTGVPRFSIPYQTWNISAYRTWSCGSFKGYFIAELRGLHALVHPSPG